MECIELRGDGDSYVATTATGGYFVLSEKQIAFASRIVHILGQLDENGAVKIEAPLNYLSAWFRSRNHKLEQLESYALHDIVLLVKVFSQLPEPLIISFIKNSSPSLRYITEFLPETYHPLALRAYQPKLSDEKSLAIASKAFESGSPEDALLPLLMSPSHFPEVRMLHICSPDCATLTDSLVNRMGQALQRLTALQSCMMYGGMLSDRVVEIVGDAVQLLPDLRTLELCRAQRSPYPQPDQALESINIHQSIFHFLDGSLLSALVLDGITSSSQSYPVHSLAELVNLHTLKLLNGAMTHDDMVKLVQHCKLKSSTPFLQLRELDLSGNQIGKHPDAAAAAAEMLSICGSLTSINLSWNSLDEHGAEAVSSALPDVADLRVLNLAGNKMKESGFDAICGSLAVLTNIECLDFGRCDAPCGSVSTLADSLSRLPCLTALNIDRWKVVNNGDFSAAEDLADALESHQNLLDLSLVQARINSEALCVLAPSVSFNEGLTSLNLMGNQIADAGILVLAQELSKLCALEVLRLEVIDVEQEVIRNCVVDFSYSLSGLSSLRVLELVGFDTAEDDAKEFVAGLFSLVRLEELKLYACGVSSVAAVAFCESLRSFTRLKVLNLGGNLLKDEGAIQLSQVLRNLALLEDLNLTSTGITGTGAAAIVDALEGHLHMTSCSISEGNHRINIHSLKGKSWVL